MTLKARRFLYIIFILLFLIITPLICLYAAGYKLGSGFSVQKTGMLTIKTEPKGALIYLNEKLQQNFLKRIFTQEKGFITTPAKIKNLLPGEYNIRLEKEGYWGWQKKLTILPGESTFVENIFLFKKDLPLLQIENVPNNISLSQDKKNVAFFDKTKIEIFDFKGNSKRIIDLASSSAIAEDNSNNLNFFWSPQNNKILLDNIIYNLDGKTKPIFLNNLIGGKIENIKWDDKDEGLIYYSSKNAINYYDTESNNSKNIINGEQIQDYLKKNNYIFYITKENNTIYLNTLNLENNEITNEIILENSSYSFINTEHELINLLDTTNNKLFLIDPFSKIKPHRATIENVKKVKRANNENLIFANDFEVWIYNFKNQNSTLLTRISDPIKEIIWHPSNNYIIFSTDNSINIIELDKRDNYNTIELTKIDEIKSPFLSQEDDNLYFYGRIGKQQGFYKLFLQ